MEFATVWKRFRLRLRYLARHSERQQLLWEEMDFHLESMAQDLVRTGMSEHDARAAAHRKFGNMTRQSEEARATWIAQWIDDAWQDLKHAFRGMRRDAGFTTFVILIAGLGIGASSTIFSVLRKCGNSFLRGLRSARDGPEASLGPLPPHPYQSITQGNQPRSDPLSGLRWHHRPQSP